MQRFIVFSGLLCFALLQACAENRLTTYMLAQNLPASAVEKKGRLQLSPPPLGLTVYAPDPEALEDLAEDLKLAAVSKYHRLPPLTFLRFDFENRTASAWRLSLSTLRFTAGDRVFGVVKADEYARRFTSVAYEHFRYDAMYASYITRRGDSKPKGDFWFEKKAPHEAIEIGPYEAGFQVLPIEFIPPGVEELTLHFSPDGGAERKLAVRLVTERGS